MKNDTREDNLRLQSDLSFSASWYDHAIEMFVDEYPNGEVWKRSCCLGGHNYSDKRQSCNKNERSEMNIGLLCETISSFEN